MIDFVTDSLSDAQFGDQRLTNRFVTIVDRLSSKPNLSIPAAMNGRAEIEAAYRFFDNPKVTPAAIMRPHIKATLERARQCDVVLLVQDTTQIDLTRPRQQVAGAGPMETEARWGAFYHPLFAFDTQGLPLGTVWSACWTRERKKKTNLTRAELNRQLKKIPIEKKESRYWLEGFCAARDVAQVCPDTECVCVCDSAADIYELFSEPRITESGKELHLLVRAFENRALFKQNQHLWDAVEATPCRHRYHIDVSARHKTKTTVEDRKRHMPREARVAQVEVRATTVTLRPPARPDRKLPPVTLNIVLVKETNPPAGQIPIEWLLITTLPIETVDQILLIVHYYSLRWQIEVYFRTLKSGCRVESRYFERLGRLLNCFAVYTIVAWKVFYLCRLSRECPDLSCELIFEPEEWKPVYMAVHQRNPPKTPPSINEMVRMIATLGGYIMRKSSQPGTQTLWIGLQRLHDLATAWKTFGPDTRR